MKSELIDFMGSDLTCVNAARVSFDKESAWGVSDEFVEALEGGGHIPATYLQPKDRKLINYLARHNHFTPFTHTAITLRETVPIFVARQRFKHVVGFTYNEVSRRYVDDEPEFYIPEVWRSRPEGSVKQGSGKEEITQFSFDEGTDWTVALYYSDFLKNCEELYRTMVSEGISPEQARMVLPQSMYTSYYVTGSLAAFSRAYKQRIDSHAQVEIQELAKQWDEIIRPLFPVSWSALCNQES